MKAIFATQKNDFRFLCYESEISPELIAINQESTIPASPSRTRTGLNPAQQPSLSTTQKHTSRLFIHFLWKKKKSRLAFNAEVPRGGGCFDHRDSAARSVGFCRRKSAKQVSAPLLVKRGTGRCLKWNRGEFRSIL